MLFKDKSSSVIYIEEVLLRPKKILAVELTDEESFFNIMGTGNLLEREVLIGEFIGSLLCRKIIAKGIYLGSRDKVNLKKNKQLVRIIAKLDKDIDYKIFFALNHAKGLNYERIGNTAMKSIDYLLRTREKDSVLWHEQGLNTNLIEFRYENMIQMSPEFIQNSLQVEICSFLDLPFSWYKAH
jgi:hypothetical protein